MSNLYNNIKQSFLVANWLNRLIYINLGVFVLLIILSAISFITGFDIDAFISLQLSLPSSLYELMWRPWTILTYMFTHFGFLHILFNMIVLFFSGRIFMDFLGDKRVLPVYILGGIAGAAVYILMYNISPNLEPGGMMIGASAGVMAIMIAAATKVPNLPVRLMLLPFEFKFWWIAVAYVLLDISGISSSNTGGHLAHLGGAMVGYLYVQALDRNVDWSNSFWDFIRRISELFKRKPKLKTVHKSRSRYSKTTQTKASTTYQTSDQARMDEILDKIKKNGYDKLSKEEKDFLFQFSKK
ncbi:rhomboid family protein [Phaeocystidibacter marisrubri]|uniref:Rhomboid family intramembrane serine protease n=1 Tax=Phaeocystidibacter marisrubri TaxID=1577780 RepID=A0A6L3ZHX1_9FLAO|nr:rhomboid family intramembrane serine protease [Phaeocystidibacter marisrubri]KAB2817219.1 rhomboid family intramembrane serine protease [Phaeocystidibacter marisrubri]GGH76374.1 rhomboid family intramembrane serine protease [Phaeocystidibacter marisrubri]